METGGDGVYEAYIVTKASKRLIVQTDKSFAVTCTDDHSGPPWAGAPAIAALTSGD